jgi:hypothetical protein
VHDVGQTLEKGSAECEQLAPRPRRHGAILAGLLEKANAELALEAPHLRMNAGLGDGIRKVARRARITARGRHAKETFELVQEDHSPTVIDIIKIGNWQSWLRPSMMMLLGSRELLPPCIRGAAMKRSVALHRLPSSSVRFVSKAVFSLAIGLVAFTQGRSARAEEISSVEPTTHSSRFSDQAPVAIRYWYGYQTVIVDVVSTSLFVSGLATFKICLGTSDQTNGSCDSSASEALLLSGLTGYALGGPVIHAAHGHWDKAGYSLALRVVPVAAAVAIGNAGSGEAGALLLIGGAGAAMMVDSAVLGFETVAVEPPKVSLAPSFDPKSRSGSLVVAGSF